MKIVKRAPSKDYESSYEPSLELIDRIAKDTREPWSNDHPALSANDVLTKLLNGETVKVHNPFGTEVEWTLENTAFDDWRREKEMKAKHKYTVEQQQDRTWAIMLGGGFLKGGFKTRGEAVYQANCMITADREAGVPVEMGVDP